MNKAEALSFISQLAIHGNQRRAAAAMGLAQSTVSGRFNKAREVLGDATVEKLMRGHGTAVASSRASAPAGTPVTAVAPASRRMPVADAVMESLETGNKEAVSLKILEEENRRLRAQNKTLADQALTDEQVRRHIFEIAHSKPTIPEWVATVAHHEATSLPGVPIIMTTSALPTILRLPPSVLP